MREYMVRLGTDSLFLWIAAVPDLRAQRIPVWIPAGFAAAALTADLFWPSCISGRELWLGAVPGAVFLLLSFMLKGKIGEGDGICVMVSGLFTGIIPTVIIVETALVMAAMAGAVGIWTKRRGTGDRIAFIPFLAAAQSLLLIIEAVRAAGG